MKGTKSLEVASRFFQCYPLADDIDDIQSGFDFINIGHKPAQNTIHAVGILMGILRVIRIYFRE